MAFFSHLSSAEPRTSVVTSVDYSGCPGCHPNDPDDCCYPCVYEHLEELAHSVSNNVIPGLERELNKVHFWWG